MSDTEQQATWNDWIGADVVDQDGDKIGSLETVYMDRASGQPEWLAIGTGMFGRNETFIPVAGIEAPRPHHPTPTRTRRSRCPEPGTYSTELAGGVGWGGGGSG